MTTYGISSTGFLPATVASITADIVTALQTSPGFGPAIDVTPQGPLGQIIGIMATREARLWELASALYDARDPALASGPLLDAIAAITGTTRNNPSYSTVAVVLTATQTLSVAAGAYVLQAPGDKVTWSNTLPISSTGSSTQTVSFQASLPGAYALAVNTLVVNTPVLGLSVASNTAATPGQARELDADFRVRRVAELAKGGSSNDDAIASALVANVPSVTYARVYSNRTAATDANGTPPNAFQVVYWDSLTVFADSNKIAQKIWDEGPAGVQAYGVNSGTAVDSNGNPHTVYFTRVAPVPIYISATTTRDTTAPADALVQCANAIVAKANVVLTVGKSVIDLLLRASCLSVMGVTDVPTFNIGTSNPPTAGTNLTITPFQIAYVPIGNVTVT
jgi:uncharacterized phage protein gp47/JayE